jgi:hypothetical protein
MNNFGSQNQGGFTPQTQGGSFSQAFGGGSQGNSPFGMQQPQPYGMQQPQPYGMQQMQSPFGGQQMQNPYINAMPGYGMSDFQQQQQQGPDQSRVLRMPMEQPGAPNQTAQQMPQQGGQRPAYMDNPDFQAYQKQEQDLGRQMNEYMQKAPMYQQIQDLQGKLRGFQQPQGQQGQMGDMRAAVMPNQSGYQGQMGDMRAAVMPQQPGSEQVAAEFSDYGGSVRNRMGMPDYGRGGGYGGGRGGYGGGRMGGGRGGYGPQMPQQDYGYGQMQNQMRQQAAFGQQQRQQYGGLDALQQYLQPPSYRPPVVAPLPLDPGLTNPKPTPAPVVYGDQTSGTNIGNF